MMFADTKFLPKAQARSVGSRKTWQLGVFEVTPTDSNWLVNRGEGEGFFHDHFCRSFLELCVRAANEVFHNDVNFVFKSKREIKSFHDHEYVSFLNNFIEKNNEQFVIFDPDANPWHTLEVCNAVVAVPFTSLVDAALYLGLPAAFYDPSGEVQPSIYHCGDLVSSYEGLCMWFSKIKNSPKQIADLSRMDFVYQNLAKSLRSTM